MRVNSVDPDLIGVVIKIIRSFSVLSALLLIVPPMLQKRNDIVTHGLTVENLQPSKQVTSQDILVVNVR